MELQTGYCASVHNYNSRCGSECVPNYAWNCSESLPGAVYMWLLP